MKRCKQAAEDKNWDELAAAAHNIAAKGRRIADVAKSRVAMVTDPTEKRKLKLAIKAMEEGQNCYYTCYYY